MEGIFRDLLFINKKGFISIVAFIILLILGIFGIGYWSASRLATDMIVKESHRIKARNLAQAGIEKVLINIVNQYRLGNTDMTYPPGKEKATAKEYSVDYGDGKYWVESVSPYSPPKSGKTLQNSPYFKNKIRIGTYDVWNIVAMGEVPNSNTTARVETLVKVIKLTTQY
ncbi:hypothetical protein HYY75_00615 [bacterium]|nr:hypothetical protein [bacterium]